MANVSQDMILEYIQKKGGRVKNVDLVKHFRKYLLYDDPRKKDQAREIFKETVNTVAFIKQEEGEKFLYLKDEYKTGASSLTSPSRTADNMTTPTPSPSHPSSGNSSFRPAEPQSMMGGVSTFNSIHSSHGQSSNINNHLSSNTTSNPSHLSSVPYSSSVPHTSGMLSTDPVSNNRYTGMPPLSSAQSSSPSSTIPYSTGSLSGRRAAPRPPIQNGGSPVARAGAHDFQPEHKSVSPQHRATRQQNGGVTSPSRSPLVSSPSPLVSSPSRSARPPPTNTSLAPPISSKPTPPTSTSSRAPPTFSKPTPSTSTTSPLHSPVGSRVNPVPPPMAASFPTSSFLDHYQQHGAPINHVTPPTSSSSHHSKSGGNKKGGHLQISSPISVHSLSNGSAMAESSDLQRITADLENFGKTGIFSDSFFGSPPSSTSSPFLPVGGTSDGLSRPMASSNLATSHSAHHHPHLSENSSLSSSSAQSTSSPAAASSSDTNLISPPVSSATVNRSTSKGSQLGVQALIQQYTVPPGAVPSLSPNKDGSPSKVSRSTSSASAQSGMSDLQLKREPTPPDIKVQRSSSSVGTVIKRNKGLNTNLGTLTRESIRASGTKFNHRLSKNSDELFPSTSHEELLGDEPERESPIDEYVVEIDPMEKEWITSLIAGDMDTIHHILMSDGTYVNRKGFLNGWTAMHWAAKLGNTQLLEALMFSGGKVDIKSHGGSTPLHLAAEAGHYRMIEVLVNEYNAPINVRDHCGLRPIDVVHEWAPNSIKSMLRRGLPNRFLPSVNASLAVPGTMLHHGRLPSKQWGSVGHLTERDPHDKKNKSGRLNGSPSAVRKGISFRRKNKYDIKRKDKGKRVSTVSEHYDLYSDR